MLAFAGILDDGDGGGNGGEGDEETTLYSTNRLLARTGLLWFE